MNVIIGLHYLLQVSCVSEESIGLFNVWRTECMFYVKFFLKS